MHYRVSQGIVLTCLIIVGLTLLYPFVFAGLFIGAFAIEATPFYYEMSRQRLNITYFQLLINTSNDITVKYQGHDYVDLPDEFTTFYADIHAESQKKEYQDDFIVDIAVIINDGRFSFAAYYSFTEDYFKLYYVDDPNGDMVYNSYVAERSAYYTFDNSRFSAIVDYL